MLTSLNQSYPHNKLPVSPARPQETFHVRTRKFLQQEVFKTEAHRVLPLDHVAGHCYVMNVKEYFKFKPEGKQYPVDGTTSV